MKTISNPFRNYSTYHMNRFQFPHTDSPVADFNSGFLGNFEGRFLVYLHRNPSSEKPFAKPPFPYDLSGMSFNPAPRSGGGRKPYVDPVSPKMILF